MRRAHATAFIAGAALDPPALLTVSKEKTMKQLIAACALALPFLAGQAFAQGSAPAAAAPAAPAAKTSQQEKMAACAKANKGKKGADYKKAQSNCLSGKTDAAPAAAPMTQQEKMAACAKTNKGKKGDEYKKAQSDCLKS
ncbi:hypothetical signal peptide protein [Ralstonia pseudosolanacearum GMI1000]|uniref:Hypothetical signal peptide protein n=2 Tax=Ralstonia pseudosolanacearum TaxID=1310165 RepID=Q8Y2D2_RALN1|nr:hypothetical signal peptide protein [Ralstonia pseudosolanacearum GMI1000]